MVYCIHKARPHQITLFLKSCRFICKFVDSQFVVYFLGKNVRTITFLQLLSDWNYVFPVLNILMSFSLNLQFVINSYTFLEYRFLQGSSTNPTKKHFFKYFLWILDGVGKISKQKDAMMQIIQESINTSVKHECCSKPYDNITRNIFGQGIQVDNILYYYSIQSKHINELS